MRRWLLLLLAGVFGLLVLAGGLVYWTHADLFWPLTRIDEFSEVVSNGATVSFRCVRQTREVWADVRLSPGGCHSSSCTAITEARSAAWVNPINGDIHVRSRLTFVNLGLATPSRACLRDCGTELGETQQHYLGILALGEHKVWLGDLWLGTIQIRATAGDNDQSCLDTEKPVMPTAPPTYSPYSPVGEPYPVATEGQGEGGYP